MMFLGRIVCVALLIASAASALAGPEDSYETTTDPKKLSWMDLGKVSVKAKLKDPDSAQFRKVYFHRGEGKIPMTCGEVNAKNSLGEESGFQRFVSSGKKELTYLEEQVSDFPTLWRRVCE